VLRRDLVIKNKIIFVNDKKIFNLRYRASLIDELSNKHLVESIGVFDSVKDFLKLIFLSFKTNIFFSSNMKANLLMLCLFWAKGIVLINGMGRYRNSSLMRLIILSMLKFNFQKRVIFQNYADYRYFKMFGVRELYWVPGSGGTKRKVGNSGVLVVTRKHKFQKVINSIKKFQKFDSRSINIVGVEDKIYLNNSVKIKFRGYVDQDKIFSFGNSILVPDGYGDGVPHSMVDAIASGMFIYLPHKLFINYGLAKLGFIGDIIYPGWVMLKPDFEISKKLELSSINKSYILHLSEIIKI